MDKEEQEEEVKEIIEKKDKGKRKKNKIINPKRTKKLHVSNTSITLINMNVFVTY